jgi:Uma2 family endonuclease
MGTPGFILERDPDTVRAPDVCFVRKGRLAGRDLTKFPEMVPDFPVEVRSPNNGWKELVEKRQQFMERGTEMVAIVEPDEFMEVHRPGQEPRRRLYPDDTFSAEDILPGFSCRVRELFPEVL